MAEFSNEELALMQHLGIPVPKQTRRKLLKVQTVCTLCKTKTVQYFSMVWQEVEGGWTKEKEVFPTDIPKEIEVQNMQVSTCKACRETLRKLGTTALVEMLIESRTYSGMVKLNYLKRKVIGKKKSKEELRI